MRRLPERSPTTPPAAARSRSSRTRPLPRRHRPDHRPLSPLHPHHRRRHRRPHRAAQPRPRPRARRRRLATSARGARPPRRRRRELHNRRVQHGRPHPDVLQSAGQHRPAPPRPRRLPARLLGTLPTRHARHKRPHRAALHARPRPRRLRPPAHRPRRSVPRQHHRHRQRRDPGTDPTPVLAAVGPLQFDVTVDRLKREFAATVNLHPTPWKITRRTDTAATRTLRTSPNAQLRVSSPTQQLRQGRVG